LNPVVLGVTARHTNGRPLACTTPNMLFGTCATLSTRRLDSLLEQAGHVFGALCLAKVEGRIVLKDGRQVIYRRARPEDEEALYQMFSALTVESLYMRYVGYHKATREEIRAILQKEGTEEISLVAMPVGRENEIVAQIRCIFLNPPTNAELAIVVHDDWQNRGLGTSSWQLRAGQSRRKSNALLAS